MGAQKYVCYAPFKNIYFGHYGRAVACCYNRDYILGEYPQQSVREIWFSKEAERLREHIKHDDLSLGCNGCKQHIISGNYDGSKSKQYDEHTLNKNKYPSVMEFELSNVCNLECAMCNGNFSSLIRAKREKLPPLHIPYDAAFVDQLEEFIPYLDEVKFYGGEPFLIDIYYDIWERIMRINPKVRISVQTNGTTLNSRLKDIMKGIDFHINVSFDSLQKETYESIRKNAVYERVMENINYFRDYCKERNTFFGISVCAMKQNWRELPDFINFCNDMDVPVYFHTVSSPIELSIRSMKAEEIDQVYNYLHSFDFSNDTSVQRKNRQHYFDFTNQVKQWQQSSADKSVANSPRSMAEVKELIVEHVMNDGGSELSVRRHKADRLMSKLTEIETMLNKEKLSEALAGTDIRDEVTLNNYVFILDKLPVSAIIAMAKASNIT